MPAPRGKKGFHRVPLSSEESNTETETEPCGEELPMDIDDAPSMESPLHERFVKTTHERCGPFSLVALSQTYHTKCVVK